MKKGINIQAQKDKKKSRNITIVIHAVLLAALAFPFLSASESIDETQPEIVVIDFSKLNSSSAKSSTAIAKTETKEALPKTEIEKVEPKVQKPILAPKPPKPVIITKNAEVKIRKAKVKVQPEAILNAPDPIPSTTPTKTKVKVKVKTKANPTKATKVGKVGKKTGKGHGSQGKSKTGDTATDGIGEKGNGGMDFDGDALLSRKVKMRADIKSLTKEVGSLVVNICVNQGGSVVYADYNKKDSSIKNKKLGQEAEKIAKKYKFEVDYKGAKKECGKLTIIIKNID